MATTLSELRKSRASVMDKIVKDLDSGGKRTEKDDRFWQLARDKAGTGSAIIRFLPPINGDEVPWVKSFSYGFQGPSGKWYINESPCSIGLPDPVMEYNAVAYASKDESRIEDAKKRKRRTQFISNILVIKDPANPENEGKVFLFKYGKKIHEMIMSKAQPEFDSDQPIFVWDIDEGCNFKIRIKNVASYPNYDSSEWAQQSPIANDDDDIQEVLNKCYKLSEFTDPSRFKTYDALKKEFDRAMDMAGGVQRTAESAAKQEMDSSDGFDLEAEVKKASQSARKVEKKETKVQDDDDDSLDAFKAMLDDI
jgi:hypothetical protein